MRLFTILSMTAALALSACHAQAPSSTTPAATPVTQAAAPVVQAPVPTTKVASGGLAYHCFYDATDTSKAMTITLSQFHPSPDHTSDVGVYALSGGQFDGTTGTVNKIDDDEYDFNDGVMLDHSAELKKTPDGSMNLIWDNQPYNCPTAG